MSFKETMRDYWRSTYFILGMTLMIAGLVLYNVITMMALNASWEQMMYYLSVSTYVLILPVVGAIMCAYGYYKVIMTD